MSRDTAPKSGARLDLLVVLLLVCFSGNEVFSAPGRTEPMLLGAALLFFALLMHRRQTLLTTQLHAVLLIFVGIFLAQAAFFMFLPVKTVAGFMIRLFVGYAAVRLVADFPLTYVKVLCWTVLLSFCFYIPEQLFYLAGIEYKWLFAPLQQMLGVPGDFHILVYNFDIPMEIHRNSAFFWEPGAFAGYLLLALALLGLRKKSLPPGFYRRSFCLLVAALLTTFSTMGYLGLPVVLLLHLPSMSKISRTAGLRLAGVTVIAVPLLLLAGWHMWRLDFVQQKLSHQYAQTLLRGDGWEKTRFGNLLFDWEYIRRKPLVGWGLHERTRFALHFGEEITGLGNGLSVSLVRLGMLGFGTWLLFLGRAVWRQSGRRTLASALALAVVLLTLNGEAYLNFPLFWGLMFLAPPPLPTPVKPEGIIHGSEAHSLPGYLHRVFP